MSFVLLVEDDESISEEIRAILEEEGHAVVQARDGREALTLLSAPVVPCVVLLDLMLPEVSGDQVLEAIKRSRQMARVPVVVTSARPDAARMAARERVGVLTKPFSLDTLVSTVDRFCESRHCRGHAAEVAHR